METEEPAEEPADEPETEKPVEEPVTEPEAEELIIELKLPETEESAEESAAEPETEELTIELLLPETEEPAEETTVEPEDEKLIIELLLTEEEAQALELLLSETPEVICDYSVTPAVTINSVTGNQSVTFTTANFPTDSTFTVSMGYYVSTWTPDSKPGPAPRPHDDRYAPDPRQDRPAPAPQPNPFYELIRVYETQPVPNFDDHDHGRKDKDGTVTTTFSGMAVGSFETGDGAPQTLTFAIPESLKNVNPIALWISDEGPCGFYSYNYFYNNSTN